MLCCVALLSAGCEKEKKTTDAVPETTLQEETEKVDVPLETLPVKQETETESLAPEKTEPLTEEKSITKEERTTETAERHLTVLYADSYVSPGFDASLIPPYQGNAWVDVSIESDLTSLWEELEPGMIRLSPFDELGRNGAAVMYAVRETLPTEERESTGMFQPSGWVQNKYPGIVDSEPAFLYNRAHEIAYCICGLSSEEANLITGTRYFNTVSMLPTELEVVRYIEDGREVLYRVTPVFESDNLLATGVLMEAQSKDQSFSICRFAYNVQPGITLDYRTGENRIEGETESAAEEQTYILNTNSHKFHTLDCDSVNDIKEKNRSEYTGTKKELQDMGYSPCKICNP